MGLGINGPYHQLLSVSGEILGSEAILFLYYLLLFLFTLLQFKRLDPFWKIYLGEHLKLTVYPNRLD